MIGNGRWGGVWCGVHPRYEVYYFYFLYLQCSGFMDKTIVEHNSSSSRIIMVRMLTKLLSMRRPAMMPARARHLKTKTCLYRSLSLLEKNAFDNILYLNAFTPTRLILSWYVEQIKQIHLLLYNNFFFGKLKHIFCCQINGRTFGALNKLPKHFFI